MTNQITQKFIDLLGPITEDKTHFSTFSNDATAGGHSIVEMSKVQKELTEQILKEHFGFNDVQWMQQPSGLDRDGKPIAVKTYKLTDSDYETYEGKTGYVYMILFSPKMYDPTYPSIPVKDGCTFGPLVYNPENFEPYRTISIRYNPTFPQDVDSKEDQTEVMKQQLRDKLEKVLANPDAYMPEAHRACLVRMAVV